MPKTTAQYLTDWNQTESAELLPVLLDVAFPNATVIGSRLLDETVKALPMIVNTRADAFAHGYIMYTTKAKDVHFITCAPVAKPGFLSLLGYVSAFDLGTWILIIFEAILTGFVWKRVVVSSKKLAYSDWFQAAFPYNILLAQSSQAIHYVKWLGGTWLLAGVVLTFFYQGDNINKLTAPISRSRLQTFEDILDAKLALYSSPAWEEGLKGHLKLIKTILVMGGDVEGVDLTWNASLTTFGLLYISVLEQSTFKNIRWDNEKIDKIEAKMRDKIKIPRNTKEVLEMLENDYYSKEIGRCEKTAYIDTFDKVERLRTQLRNKGIIKERISTSKSPYGRLVESWDFENVPGQVDALFIRIHSLLHSGLIHLWENWKTRIETWNVTVADARNVSSTVKAYSTTDNIVVVFYCHASLLGAGVFVFLVEDRRRLINKAVFYIIVVVGCIQRWWKWGKDKLKRARKRY